MNEQEGFSSETPEEENELSREDLNKAISAVIELIETRESYSGHLEDEEKADLIDGLRNVNILDSHAVEEREAKEYLLDTQEIIMEVYGMLEQYDIPAEQILREVGLLE